MLGSLVTQLSASGIGSLLGKRKRKQIEEKVNSGILDKEDLIWISSYLYEKKEYDKAEIYALKLLEICPNDPEPRNILFNIYFWKKEFRKAIPHVEFLIQLGKEVKSHYHNLGYCYFLLDEIEKSDEYRIKAESIDPDLKKYPYRKF